MKNKLINFETFGIRSVDSVKQQIDLACSQGYTSIIGLLLADGFLYNDYNDIVEYTKSKGVDIKIIAGMSYKNSLDCEVIEFNFNLHTVYNSYKNATLSNYTSSNKFLFLGGVPDRLNRIGLLHKIYKKDLLKYGEWSFFAPWTEEQEKYCKAFFTSNDEYKEFISFVERKIDNLYDNSKHYGTDFAVTDWTNNSSWIDPTIFKNAGLSVISEGHPGDDNTNSAFLTEKTYRVFVQGHPFLFAGNPSMFEYIKELGFKTFENYFPHTDYATVTNENERLDLLVDNLSYFVYNKSDYSKDVEYNRNHFFNLAKQNCKILRTLDADKKEIDFYFDRKGFGHLI